MDSKDKSVKTQSCYFIELSNLSFLKCYTKNNTSESELVGKINEISVFHCVDRHEINTLKNTKSFSL